MPIVGNFFLIEIIFSAGRGGKVMIVIACVGRGALLSVGWLFRRTLVHAMGVPGYTVIDGCLQWKKVILPPRLGPRAISAIKFDSRNDRRNRHSAFKDVPEYHR